MPSISGFDHAAITVADLDAACGFYRDAFGAQQVNEHAVAGNVALRQIAIGGALLSVHQAGNGSISSPGDRRLARLTSACDGAGTSARQSAC